MFNCSKCNNNYKSRQSLWNHINKYHANDEPINKTKKYCYDNCGKEYSHIQSKSRHMKTCNVVPINNTEIINEINEMKTKIYQLETKPSIVNYNTTHNTNNTQNIIIASPPGLETVENINSQQKKFIINKGLSSLLYLIETTNFDKNAPQ